MLSILAGEFSVAKASEQSVGRSGPSCGRSKYELGWHVSPTANQHDAITAVELALAEAERLATHP